MPNTVHALLHQGTDGDVALTAPGRPPLSYGAVRSHVAATVEWLNRFGIGRHDRVAILLPGGPEMALAFLAIAAGATAAPLNPVHRAEEFALLLRALRPKALVTVPGRANSAVAAARTLGIPIVGLTVPVGAAAGIFRLSAPDPPIDRARRHAGLALPEDIALLLRTSATTGRAKLVALSHLNLSAGADNVRRSLALNPADRCLNIMPLFHVHGLVGGLLSSVAAGASVACATGFNPFRVLGMMRELRPTWYTAAPSVHQVVVQRVRRHREIAAAVGLRLVRSSSAPLRPRLMADLEAAFDVPVIESYGLTEAAHQVTSNPLPPGKRKPGSVGLAAGADVAIMDTAGNLLPAGQVGGIVVRGQSVMGGYVDDPAANALAFTSGWLRTGDQGVLDEEGYLTLTGRFKEMINRGGEKVSPLEVDEVLLDHPAVLDAVTFPVPDDLLGEDVAAAVVLRAGARAEARELRAFAAARLAVFKVPRTLFILDAIPVGPTGKPQRMGLAERLGLGSPHSRT